MRKELPAPAKPWWLKRWLAWVAQQKWRKFYDDLVPTVVKVGSTVAMVVTVAFVIYYLFSGTILISTIEVPAALSQSGYTSDVIAQRILDEANDFDASSLSSMKHASASVKIYQREVSIPETKISPSEIANFIRGLFKRDNRITGEVLVSGNKFLLVLRYRGAVITSDEDYKSNGSIEGEITKAARAVVRVASPYIYASALYRHHELDQAYRQASRITSDDQSYDAEAIARAYNLEAIIMMDTLLSTDKKPDETTAFLIRSALNDALKYQDGMPQARANMCRLNVLIGRYSEAENDCNDAMQFAVVKSSVEADLGDMSFKKGNLVDAKKWYEKSIDDDISINGKHLSDQENYAFLALAQNKLEDYDGAEESLRLAIQTATGNRYDDFVGEHAFSCSDDRRAKGVSRDVYYALGDYHLHLAHENASSRDRLDANPGDTSSGTACACFERAFAGGRFSMGVDSDPLQPDTGNLITFVGGMKRECRSLEMSQSGH